MRSSPGCSAPAERFPETAALAPHNQIRQGTAVEHDVVVEEADELLITLQGPEVAGALAGPTDRGSTTCFSSTPRRSASSLQTAVDSMAAALHDDREPGQPAFPRHCLSRYGRTTGAPDARYHDV